jgi:hypothetical protein
MATPKSAFSGDSVFPGPTDESRGFVDSFACFCHRRTIGLKPSRVSCAPCRLPMDDDHPHGNLRSSSVGMGLMAIVGGGRRDGGLSVRDVT